MKPAHIRAEIPPMLQLALPLVLAELGWMSMGIVDTIMVGHLPDSAVSLGAAALGQVLFHTLAFGIGGMLLGLDTVLSQAYGGTRIDDANRSLQHGLVLAGILTVILMSIVALMPIGLAHIHMDHRVFVHTLPFLNALNWSTPPLLLWMVLRRYLQAFNHVRSIAATLVSANLINILGNWLFIYGHHWYLGSLDIHIHAYGVTGSGWSTMASRCYQAAFMLAAVIYYDRRHHYGLLRTKFRYQWTLLRELITIGGPVGAQIFVEIGVFGAVTAVIATFGPLQLAGHQIALDCASFTFMVPMAISAATSVRVGQAIGRRDPNGASAAGWSGIALGAGFMLFASVVMVSIPHLIARGFSPDPTVIAAAVPLLYVASAFQFFDGVQITASGALRGAGNTHAGLIVHSIGYWCIGMPLGLLLAFRLHLGALGLWLGLCAALIIAGISLIIIWRNTTHRLMV